MKFLSTSDFQIKNSDKFLDSVDKEYVLKVHDLAEVDRPREKILAKGSNSLTVSELLANIIITGTKKEDVLAMCGRVLKEYGEGYLISESNPAILAKELGIPLVKACQIVSCFELGRRFFQKTRFGHVTLRNARQTYNYLKEMGNLPKENLRGIYLNSHYKIIHDEIISVGSLTTSIVHPREVFRPAIEKGAAALIVAHNHPSGSLKPTSADIQVTKQLIEAGKIMGIDLIDHLIVTKNSFLSILTN